MSMSAVAATTAAPSNLLNGYLAVHVEMLRRLKEAAVDLFVQDDAECAPVLYQRAGGELDAALLTNLAESGIQKIYVRLNDFHRLGARLVEELKAADGEQTMPPADQFAALQMALAGEIERTAHMIECGPYIELSHQVGQQLAALFASSEVLPRDLFCLARHDFNTFTHVTNVAGYSVILAKRLGLCSESDLDLVAKGAMLHDIGKRFIPHSILTKPSKLNPAERAIIETHPQRSYEDLYDRPDVTLGQLMMAYQHHERLDGTGYPVGLAGDDIHPWARLLAVVDVFDAMTGMRPYRKPASADTAMEYLRQNAGTHFDPEVVKCWESAMSGL